MTTLVTRIRALFWSALAVTSLVLQWFVGHPGESVWGPGGLHFFSYFTIETNLAMALWFFARAWIPRSQGWGSGALRLAITGYALVTMVVFWVLLAPTYHPAGWGIPANYGLHLVMPLAMIGEWLLDRPVAALTWKASVAMLSYPLLYCAYSLILGYTTGWFPYFFLDVPQQGVGVTAAYIGGLVAFFAVVALALTGLWNRLRVQGPASQTTAT